MNVDSIIFKIKLFEELVIESGFKRDVADFIQSIHQAQNQNLVFMKDLSKKIQEAFLIFEKNSLDTELNLVLRENEAFTSKNTIKELQELDENKNIDAPTYFNKLITIFNNLTSSIESNTSEIKTIKKVFIKYLSGNTDLEAESGQALVSLVFKDAKSKNGLKEFSKVLNKWNTTILTLHQLVKSESPEEVSLVQIQNGSIDVIFNIDINVAVDLAKLIEIGLTALGAYLLYKTDRAKEIVDSFLGNTKLIEMEAEREKLMLENIKESVKNEAKAIHSERLQNDSNIDQTSVDKKIDSVSTAITDHIVKGNEVRLLTELNTETASDDEDSTSKKLREKTAIARERQKKLSSKDKQLLLETYSAKDEDG